MFTEKQADGLEPIILTGGVACVRQQKLWRVSLLELEKHMRFSEESL